MIAEAAYYMLHAGAVYGWKYYQQTQLRVSGAMFDWLRNTLSAWSEPVKKNMSVRRQGCATPV